MIERANLTASRRALFSDCGRYRYTLKISWADQGTHIEDKFLAWICLNPSTADEFANDPSVTRMVDFAARWGYGACLVLNLFGYRSKNPRDLLLQQDPVGPEYTIEFLQNWTAGAGKVMAGWGRWGSNPILTHRARAVRAAIPMYCLKKNLDGSPEHPLYLKKTLEPVPWNF